MTEEALRGKLYAEMAQAEKAEKLCRFRHLNPYAKQGQIVFAGSSLMEQFPIYEFLQDFDLPYTIYNRGVGGFTTRELLPALKECVYDLRPRFLFLNIGTNDLNGEDYVPEELIARYDEILREIKAHVPGVKIFLLAYYPVNPAGAKNEWMRQVFRRRTNARIREANEAVAALAGAHGAEFLNLNAGITDENGNLKLEYTIDGMHMYANGYKKVLEALQGVLESLK